ncbi:MAG: hypothetical protein WA883_02280 [Phormidesmis sp.]
MATVSFATLPTETTAQTLPTDDSSTATPSTATPSTATPFTVTPSTDSAYLNQLYSLLQRQDAITHAMATQSMSAEDNIRAAQMFCRTFDLGVSPTEAFSIYTTSAINQAASLGADITEELAHAVGVYGGAVMSLGATHYCPQHQSQVQQALESFQ